jgi:hypothetical protein
MGKEFGPEREEAQNNQKKNIHGTKLHDMVCDMMESTKSTCQGYNSCIQNLIGIQITNTGLWRPICQELLSQTRRKKQSGLNWFRRGTIHTVQV